MQLMETDGTRLRQREAVFRSLSHAPRGAGSGELRALPGFRPDQRTRVFAASRAIARSLPRARGCFWGEDVRRPTYFITRRAFLKSLGLIYLVAFISLWVQVDGLMGTADCCRQR